MPVETVTTQKEREEIIPSILKQLDPSQREALKRAVEQKLETKNLTKAALLKPFYIAFQKSGLVEDTLKSTQFAQAMKSFFTAEVLTRKEIDSFTKNFGIHLEAAAKEQAKSAGAPHAGQQLQQDKKQKLETAKAPSLSTPSPASEPVEPSSPPKKTRLK